MKVEFEPGWLVEQTDLANAEILVRWETFGNWNLITQAAPKHISLAVDILKHRLRILEGEQARRAMG